MKIIAVPGGKPDLVALPGGTVRNAHPLARWVRNALKTTAQMPT